MTSNDNKEVFLFQPLQSFVSPTFWHKLSEIKIDFDRLSDAAKPVHGFYTNFNSKSCLLEVDYSSFNTSFNPPKNHYTAFGTLYNKNTIEDFKECDKNALLQVEGQKFLDDIATGAILDDPRLLARFMILSFADLKTHNYYYWFAFPCPLKPTLEVERNSKPCRLADQTELSHMIQIIESIPDENRSFFILNKTIKDRYIELKDLIDPINLKDNLKDENIDDLYFCFVDPSEYESPSWMMRTYSTFLHLSCPSLAGKYIKFIGVRYNSEMKYGSSLIWTVQLPQNDEYMDDLKFVGWEPNKNNKMGPRMVSMRESMDPAKLAENSINLNLKLMKWRLVPDLNLETMAETKCLLFGAGTLGCAVARNLLSWGFKYITLIDNGKVSFSNPVRQNLYTHQDAVQGNNMKATIAAERLKEINPNAITKGYVMQIPMPGHTIGDSMKQGAIEDLEKIISLVQEHDVIFLLTDSRESRWLPTMLGVANKKIVLNAALGFDSYLVMRHGNLKEVKDNSKYVDIGDLRCISGSELGCYFCNDITAPGNSLKDRTLDQQCTVTRPGVSNIAASYAVELLVSILQHPDKDSAPAYFCANAMSTEKVPEGLLGIIPHSIRGMLFNYENILPATKKFPQCIACSEKIVNEFQANGIEFLLKAFETTKYLEDLTGISELMNIDANIIECDDSDFELSDDE
ncbi:ubiquitin-like modifier-activating enzyme ATG7 [Episyrphus balteatus]|uniref:ubiquitin-like modifier-activating enzyme ATG7 n=1 Tax=Episyrphus balteatus TaxID=286459 RepID=UPI002486A00A|nr:ubiquitin-like modifier-activating enzyme ATG7 [Episyrphus balteatus]